MTDETPRPAEPADSPSWRSVEPQDTPGWSPPAAPTNEAPPPPPPPLPHPGPMLAAPPSYKGQPAPMYAPPVPVGAPMPQWGRPAAVPPPPREAWLAPRRVEAIPGTRFAVVHLDVPAATSGLAIGSLVAGIGSILVSFVVTCFGLLGATDGWGALVGGAFGMIAGLAGAAAIVLAILGLRQIRRAVSGIRLSGRGVAIAGIVCGGVGLGITLLALGASLLIQVSV